MNGITTVGLDLSKNVFQVHGSMRIAWAVMHRQENYQRMATAA